MNKKVKIALWCLFAIVSVAILVLYIVFPDQTTYYFNCVKDFINKPLPIVGISLFVYKDMTSVFLSVVQIFVSECIVTASLKRDRYAIEVKIVTKNPNEIRDEILYTHKHGATVVKSSGMYSGDDNYIIFSVMSVKEIPKLMEILKKHPESFVYFSDGVRVQGDFHFRDDEIGQWIAAFK